MSRLDSRMRVLWKRVREDQHEAQQAQDWEQERDKALLWGHEAMAGNRREARRRCVAREVFREYILERVGGCPVVFDEELGIALNWPNLWEPRIIEHDAYSLREPFDSDEQRAKDEDTEHRWHASVGREVPVLTDEELDQAWQKMEEALDRVCKTILTYGRWPV